MRVVTVRTLQPLVVHHAVQEGITLHAIFVGGPIAPEFRRLSSRLRLETDPEIRQLFAGLISDRPGIFRQFWFAGLMTREADLDRPLHAQTRGVDDIVFRKALRVLFPGAVTTLAGNVQFRPTL